MSLNRDQLRLVDEVLAEVSIERYHQHQKWGEQNHPNGTGPDVREGRYSYRQIAEGAKRQTDAHAEDGTLTYLDILVEEVAEAASEADPDRLREELVQVAAVAVAWIEKIDRDRSRS